MQEEKTAILCLHQAAELYGSDRSFLSAVQALADSGANLDVILPVEGELAEELRKVAGLRLSFFDKGILRKRELQRPFAFMWRILIGWLFYLRRFSSYRVVYINTVVMFSALLAACCYRFSSRRIICHVREIPGGAQLRFFRALFRLAAIELIYNSNATRDAFGLPGQVIYNGVEAQGGGESSAHQASGQLNLLVIGRINQWKGQDFFLESVGALPVVRREGLRIRIVGSPFEGYEYLEAELNARIRELGLEYQVEMIPFCADPSEHYRWSDYVVVPSTQPEPFGRVAIEAFAFGKPVIAAAHGGLIEIVDDGSTGLLFTPGDVQALGQAFLTAQEFSAERYAALSCNAWSKFQGKFSLAGYKANIRAFFFG